MGVEGLTETELEFNRLLELWIKHCNSNGIRNSPNPRRFRDCDAYRRIVAMGEPALPYLLKVYSSHDDKEAFFALWDSAIAVEEITKGKFKIPWYIPEGPIRGHTREIRDYTVAWLAEYLKDKKI